MIHKFTTDSFIERCKKLHGENYDYSKIVYINLVTEIKMVCSIHGEFITTPKNVLRNKIACPKCSKIYYHRKKIKKNKDIFISKAKEKFGDTFNLDNINYKGIDFPINIICKKHGEVRVIPSNFLNSSYGCPKCGNEQIYIKKTGSFEDFVIKANKIHNNKYTYKQKGEYKNVFSKIIICCAEHGETVLKAEYHLYNKTICSRCGIEKRSKKRSLDFEKWKNRLLFDHATKIEILDPENYKNGNSSLLLKCNNCNYIFKKRLRDISKKQHHICFNCYIQQDSSLFEIMLKQIFNKYMLKYTEQKSFLELKHINKLKIDFYLLEYNIAVECQGRQHYKPSKFFGGEKQFLEQINRDQIKRDYCVENEIFLIEIPYWKKDNLEEYLLNRLEEFGISLNLPKNN